MRPAKIEGRGAALLGRRLVRLGWPGRGWLLERTAGARAVEALAFDVWFGWGEGLLGPEGIELGLTSAAFNVRAGD